MIKTLKKALISLIFLLYSQIPLSAADVDLLGQFSLQGLGKHVSNRWDGEIGLRYIPRFLFSRPVAENRIIDTEISLNGFLQTGDEITVDNIELYRLTARYATTQSEIQLGLQKINFGPAQLLRSLMWFDRLNPTDPLRIAAGVWGLRYRYIFLNNANVWLWGLFGNGEPKGMETYGSVKTKPEFGGRVQTPVPRGEIALTGHTRTLSNSSRNFRENRIAFDGRWDIVVGAWVEAVVQYQEIASPYHYTKMLTLGLDYTFGIGNGVYILAEHMINQLSNDFYESDLDAQLSALTLNYPLGIFDNFSLMAFYSWKTDDIIQYASWQRTYDKIVLSLALFHYPDMQISMINTTGGGYGAQVMLIYNH